jgi:colanic acid biosynthesis protein WcaH
MDICTAISFLDGQLTNKTEGLPDEIFYFISRCTPLTNVDLLVKDEDGRTLLAWRDDEYCGAGWHIPGGIIRFKETIHTRISKVALGEIGADVEFDDKPIAITEFIHQSWENRAHFVSLLYRCSLPTDFSVDNKGKKENETGFLKWHDKCPDNIISAHNVYREYI